MPTASDHAAPGEGAVDRPMLVRIAVGLLAALTVIGVAAVVLRPSDPAVPGPGFRSEFLGACERTGVDADACRCGFDRWTGAVPEAQLAGLDAALADGADLPDDVHDAVTSFLRDTPDA